MSPADLRGRPVRPRLADRPIPELVQKLGAETSTLVRQELDLLRAEMAEKGKNAGLGVGLMGGGAALALYGLGALTFCFITALALHMELWLASLIVAVVYFVIAGLLAYTGKTKLAQAGSPAPEQTIETVQEDVEWLKTSAASGRR
jgi:uncharacterized membrane protein YqjE